MPSGPNRGGHAPKTLQSLHHQWLILDLGFSYHNDNDTKTHNLLICSSFYDSIIMLPPLSKTSYLPLDSDAPYALKVVLVGNYVCGEWWLYPYNLNTSHLRQPVAFMVRNNLNWKYVSQAGLWASARCYCCMIMLSLWTRRYDACLLVCH